MKKILMLLFGLSSTALLGTDNGNFIQNGDFESMFPNVLRDITAIPNGEWGEIVWVHLGKSDGDYREFLKKLRPITKKEIISDTSVSGNHYLRISTGKDGMEWKNNSGKGISYSSQLCQKILLPEPGKQIKFRLSFRMRGRLDANGSIPVHVTMYKGIDPRAEALDGKYKIFTDSAFKPGNDWKEYSLEFTTPPEAKMIRIGIALYGSGSIELDDIRLTAMGVLPPQKKNIEPSSSAGKSYLNPGGVSVDLRNTRYSQVVSEAEKAYPLSGICKPEYWISVCGGVMSFMDNLFCIPRNQSMPFMFFYRNLLGKPMPSQMDLVVKVPSAITVEPVNPQLKVLSAETKNGFVTYRFRASTRKLVNRDYNIAYSSGIFLRTAIRPGPEHFPMEFYLEYDGWTTRPSSINLQVIPEIYGKSPCLFGTGGMGILEYFDADHAEKFADFYQECGFNQAAFNLVLDNPMPHAMKKRGITRFWSNYWFTDGYTIGREPKPKEVSFTRKDGSIVSQPQCAGICPVEVYRKGEYYRKYVEGYLEEILYKLDVAEHVLTNWEPNGFGYAGNVGCFCRRCKQEFICFSGLNVAEVDRLWPQTITEKYSSLWKKFRSWQHAQLSIQLQRSLNELAARHGRKESFLIQEVNAANFYSADPGSRFAEFSVLDYLDQLPWTNPWGPYIYQDLKGGYREMPGAHVNTWVAAQVLKKILAEKIPDPGKRPRLMAFPQGNQCTTWITEPEALSFETLAFYFAGWESSMAYYLVNSLDARYWRAMAETNTLIAETEPFLFYGNPVSDVSVSPLSPLPTPVYVDPSSVGLAKNYGERIRNSSMLITRSFRLDKSLLIALGNAWQDGEVFAEVCIPRMKEGNYAVRSVETGALLLSPAGNRFWTAAELEKGMTVHVGALRWALLRIQPETLSDIGTISVTQEEIRKAMKERLPFLTDRCKWDSYNEKTNIVHYDFSSEPKISNGDITAIPRDGINSSVIHISAPDYSADLNMGQGGCITNWRVNGKNLSDDKFGFGADAFWLPASAACRLASAYSFFDMIRFQNGIRIILEHKMTPRDPASLKNLLLRKTIDFFPCSIVIRTTLKNTGNTEINIGFRFHNLMPFMMDNGRLTMGEIVFSRTRKNCYFEYTHSPDRKAPFDSILTGKIRTADWTASASSLPKVLEIRVHPEKTLKGVMLWDAADNKIGVTLEPFFMPEPIRPGDSVEYTMKFNLTI